MSNSPATIIIRPPTTAHHSSSCIIEPKSERKVFSSPARTGPRGGDVWRRPRLRVRRRRRRGEDVGVVRRGRHIPSQHPGPHGLRGRRHQPDVLLAAAEVRLSAQGLRPGQSAGRPAARPAQAGLLPRRPQRLRLPGEDVRRQAAQAAHRELHHTGRGCDFVFFFFFFLFFSDGLTGFGIWFCEEFVVLLRES